MNKKQYKLIALSLAMTMAVSSISYAANADRKVSAAAKTDNEVLTVAKKDIIRKNETKVSSGPVIEEPEIPAKSKISFTRLGSKKVKISWSRSTGAEKYILYKKTNSNGYKIVATTTKLKFTDKKVVAKDISIMLSQQGHTMERHMQVIQMLKVSGLQIL